MLGISYSLTCGLSLSQTFQGVTLLRWIPLKKKKNRISFKINVGTTNKCMVDKCKTISGLLLENL